MPSLQENLVQKLENISNAMTFGTQSRSSSLILNIIFENCGSWPEIKYFSRFGLKIAMCSNFYEIWHLVQMEHAYYEYNTRQFRERSRNYWLRVIIGSEWL